MSMVISEVGSGCDYASDCGPNEYCVKNVCSRSLGDVLPAIVPPKGIDQGTNVPSTAVVTPGGYVTLPTVKSEIDTFLPQHGPLDIRKPVPTWAWVAGGTFAVLVTYMLLKPTRGITRSAPATAGLGRLQRARRSKKLR